MIDGEMHAQLVSLRERMVNRINGLEQRCCYRDGFNDAIEITDLMLKRKACFNEETGQFDPEIGGDNFDCGNLPTVDEWITVKLTPWK